MKLISTLIALIVINASSFTIYDALVVYGEDYTPIGMMRPEARKEMTVNADSVRIAFTVDREYKEWYATELMPVGEIILTDSTQMIPIEVSIE